MDKYLHQTSGTCCILYALLNARRYFGLPTPEQDTVEFEDLIDKAKCRYGAALGVDALAASLGLTRTPIEVYDVIKHVPSMMIVYLDARFSQYLQEVTGERHMVLVIGGNGDSVELVNYRSAGPVVETVRWCDLNLPKQTSGIFKAKAWSLTKA